MGDNAQVTRGKGREIKVLALKEMINLSLQFGKHSLIVVLSVDGEKGLCTRRSHPLGRTRITEPL